MRIVMGSARLHRLHYEHWLIRGIVVWATVFASVGGAQSSNRPELRIGVGTFLSRDRGWNYEDQIEVFAAVAQKAGSLGVEAGASFFKSFARTSQPAVFPLPPGSFTDGFAARLHVRVPNANHSVLNTILGAELLSNRTDREARVTTVAGTVGIGINFGPARRGALDLRYVKFANHLGSSSGILPLTLAWRL